MSNEFFKKFAFFETARTKCIDSLTAFIESTALSSQTASTDNNLNILYTLKQFTII